jgi:hypothetical protein
VWENQATAKKIATEAFEIITNTSGKFRFFNGKSSRSILSGLFYLLGFRYNAVRTQKEIAVQLITTDVTVRDSYRR